MLSGGHGEDIITTGAGADTVNYTSVLDGHDVITDFTGGQDTRDLDQLFAGIGVAAGDRAGRVAPLMPRVD